MTLLQNFFKANENKRPIVIPLALARDVEILDLVVIAELDGIYTEYDPDVVTRDVGENLLAVPGSCEYGVLLYMLSFVDGIQYINENGVISDNFPGESGFIEIIWRFIEFMGDRDLKIVPILHKLGMARPKK